MNRQKFIKNLGVLSFGYSLSFGNDVFAKTSLFNKKPNKQNVVLFSLGGGIRIQDLEFMSGLFELKSNNVGINVEPKVKNKVYFTEIVSYHPDHSSNWNDFISASNNGVGHDIFDILIKHKGLRSEEIHFLESGIIPRQRAKTATSHLYQRFENDIETLNKTEDLLKMKESRFIISRLNSFDVCHYNFTKYKENLTLVSERIGNVISNQSKYTNTVFIVVSEMGRNLLPNHIVDFNGKYGYDHFDDNSKRAWTLVFGDQFSDDQFILSGRLKSINNLGDVAQLILSSF